MQSDTYARMIELLEEEKEYCDKGNYKHMAQILTSIALYETLQKHGKSEEEAYKAVSEVRLQKGLRIRMALYLA